MVGRKANSTVFKLIWSLELIINCIAIGLVFFRTKDFLLGLAPAVDPHAYPDLFPPVIEGFACMFGTLLIALTVCEYRAIVSDNVEAMSAMLLGLLVGDLVQVYAAYRVADSVGGWSRNNIASVAIALLLAVARVAWFSLQPRKEDRTSSSREAQPWVPCAQEQQLQ
ncbi:hypothetical protein DUNSADRAFT_6246 [Dunaliella salina]|uniref:Uncharacterized protein n=1 Tax=Dunaliella salina TaxID=3046 RepID=A0ABQ7GNP2_DUNSA|nr:hypothetical protein DUNSADRAFT_6246 [Dunaliella salina]|eukprot:KAF5836234.1 hypothetical protein DUNSADRAFT_6246 [Dunaliella salina]